ncbi:SRPBCC family protein [Kocuria nitroreducens]|uniref:SRPBCC family protein n=1 Tax=Kocuria nitroreducens TaxID=3058914 RepID=UPI0036DA95DC
MTNTLHVTAPEGVPCVDYSREFDAPAAEVFRAHADPELYRQWIGPRGLETRIDGFDCRSGGSYRFVQRGAGGGDEYAFHGVFHTVRRDALIVQTFEFEGWPDVVTLEFSTFEDLPGGRSRLTGRSVHPSVESREQYLATGMEAGMAEGYDRLEELLSGRSAQDGA